MSNFCKIQWKRSLQNQLESFKKILFDNFTKELDFFNERTILIVFPVHDISDCFLESISVDCPETAYSNSLNWSRSWCTVKKCKLSKTIPMLESLFTFTVDNNFAFSLLDNEVWRCLVTLLEDKIWFILTVKHFLYDFFPFEKLQRKKLEKVKGIPQEIKMKKGIALKMFNCSSRT